MIRMLVLVTAIATLGWSAAVAQHSSSSQPPHLALSPAQIDSTVTDLMASAHVTGAGIAPRWEGCRAKTPELKSGLGIAGSSALLKRDRIPVRLSRFHQLIQPKE